MKLSPCRSWWWFALLAFVLVCAGVWVLRVREPNAPRAFKTPLVPLVPILGIASCLLMMVFLPFDTWYRLLAWLVIGLDLYIFYGMRNSVLGRATLSVESIFRSRRVVAITGLVCALLFISLVVIEFVIQRGKHAEDPANFPEEPSLPIASTVFCVVHLGIYIALMIIKPKMSQKAQ